jgi:hypothetical protein
VAVAVNCRVAPTATLGVDDVTEIDVSVLAGGGTVLPVPEHPVFAITSGSDRRQARRENDERRRMATCMNLPNMNLPKLIPQEERVSERRVSEERAR